MRLHCPIWELAYVRRFCVDVGDAALLTPEGAGLGHAAEKLKATDLKRKPAQRRTRVRQWAVPGGWRELISRHRPLSQCLR